MNIKEKMHSGELYYPGDETLMKEQLAYLEKLYDFNMTRPTEQEKRKDSEKKREWQCCFFCPVSWVWYF